MRARLAVLTTVVLALAGCGERPEPAGGPSGGGVVTVSAAASLTEALEEYGRDFDGAVRHSFAGSDELAAQIRQGARPDVYAAANTKLPDALAREGLVERPVVFATNRLVLAVPADSRIRSLEDLERPGVNLVVGSPSVPVGSYTREVLARLGREPSRRILANVRSEEPDVKGVVGKLTQGAADAGFVYASDVAATNGGLRAIELPAKLKPQVSYGVALVKGGADPRAAKRWVDGLRRGAGARVLREKGFGPPPGE